MQAQPAPILNILAREVRRERWIASATDGACRSVARANACAAIVRYCRLADAGRKLEGLVTL